MGRDSWQPAKIATAYALAQSLGNFKMFFSLDMTSFGCGSAADAQVLANLVRTYVSHPAQARYRDRPLVSTFAGNDCSFGQGSAQNGWNYFRSLVGTAIYFVPATFQDVSTFQAANWFEGVFNWNAGWALDNNDITTALDDRYLNALRGKGYMTAVSPWFFTYYGPNS
jgi:glucan endo-1,3-alpha-glucosidase